MSLKNTMISQSALARELCIDRRTVSNRLDGVEPDKMERGAKLYGLRKVIGAFAQDFGEVSGGRLDPAQERARLTAAQAEAQERKNQVESGELAPIQIIEDVLNSASIQLVAILEALPKKIKMRSKRITWAELKIIEEEIVKARNTAANIKIG